MRIRWIVLGGAALALAAPMRGAAQEFKPPRVSGASSGTHLGLFGFGVRGGIDLKNRGQVVVGTALDLGDLFSSRVRLRPSGEIGVFNGGNSYVGSLEALYRFTDDDQVAIPYIGTGLSLAGHEHCGEPRLRVRAPLQVHLQLAARVPRDGRAAAAPGVHRTHHPSG